MAWIGRTLSESIKVQGAGITGVTLHHLWLYISFISQNKSGNVFLWGPSGSSMLPSLKETQSPHIPKWPQKSCHLTMKCGH